MTETSPTSVDGANERLAALEAKVGELHSMLIGQTAWMSDMQQEVVAGVREMSGAVVRAGQDHDGPEMVVASVLGASIRESERVPPHESFSRRSRWAHGVGGYAAPT